MGDPDSSFLSGGGEMGARMRDFDWSRTALGPIAKWPQSLRTSVSTCLNSRFAIVLWWGSDQDLITLYNDAYIPILGKKHPAALGDPAQSVWPEIWHIIGPMLKGVMERGDATWSDNLLLELERGGYPEELYFTFSYSPIRDESGGIGGVFTPVQETTGAVIGERRLRTLRDLAEAARASNAQSQEEVCRVAADKLARNCQDIPFAAFYLFSQNGREACLTASAGFSKSLEWLPGVVSLPQRDWIFAESMRGGPHVLTLPTGLQDVPCGAWPVPPEQVMILPIAPGGQTIGAIILGVSPRKKLDEDYRSFLSLVGGHVTTAIAEARAFEEERHRAEALAELDRSKTAFFSNVSHEFRTPLTLMLGPLEEMLAMNDVPAAVTNLAAMTHRNGLRLQKLVNTLLDFSRIEAGRLHAAYEATDLTRFTAELASTFRAAVEKAGLRFVVDCQPLPDTVYVDREMWEKIVLNLLSNAFKYTLKGEIAVRLEARGERALLSVADTGSGIPESELPHLFERFHRVEGTRGRTQEGTGIGLALVEELIRLQGGSVEVSSKVGEGSVFTVSLPFGNNHLTRDRVVAGEAGSVPLIATPWLDASAYDEQKPDERRDGSTVQRDTILVVDDNPDMRSYIARLLAENYSVKTASNGEEALASITQDPPDLVLSDVMMPGLDGFGLIAALRKDVRTHALPVILLSARAGEGTGVEGLQAGASDYLIKPFTARELLARVSTHLEMARIRKEAGDVLESITDGFFALDRNWCFTYVNAAAERMMGTREELLGRSHWEVFPSTVGSIGDREYHRAVRERVAVEFEILYEPWQRWYSVRAYPGKTEGLSVYFRDVTEQKRVRATLEESEKRFRAMADSAPVLIWTTDTGGACLWVNRPWLEFTGRTLQDECGFGWTESVHPDDIGPSLGVYQAALKNREPFQVDYRLRRHDGQWRWIFARARPLNDADGVFNGYIGSCVDITDRKETEEALRESEERFRTMADNIPNLAWMAHGNGDIFWYNQRWYEYTGGTLEEMQGWRWEKIHDPALLPLVKEIWRSSLETGRGFTMEFPLLGRDGVYRWFLTQARPIRNQAGKVVRWFGTNTNIDEEKQTREALRESEELTRSVIEGSPDSVEVLDRDGRTILINQQGRKFLELSGRTIGVNWAESWSEEIQQQAATVFAAVAAGRAARFEAVVRPEGGAPVYLDLSASPLVGANGEVSRILCVTRDVTAARRAEEELRQTARLESLGVMAGGIAHDFNNLLTGILGNASLLRESASEEDRGMADDIVLAAERAADLTKQMLAFSGKGRFQICKIDLSVMVRDMLRLAKPSIEKNVEIELELGDQCIMEGDPGQLQQVVMNLMINAAEAMEGKPGAILVRTSAVDADSGYLSRAFGTADAAPGACVVLEVIDHGKGMDDATKARIFDPFFTTKFTGRGLGLAAVSGIVRGHKGLLRVDSAPGAGTRFRVLFPAVSAPAATSETKAEIASISGRGVILLVDDEDIVRRIGTEVLKRHGYEVRLAADGKEALEVFETAHGEIDAVVLDMMMPVMNGEEALRGLHQIDASVPVVICSGQNEAELIERMTAQKVGAFLQKPYTAARLLEKIQTVLPDPGAP